MHVSNGHDQLISGSRCLDSYLNDDVHVELLGIKAQGFVEGRALMVVQVHSDVNLRRRVRVSVQYT